MTFQWNVSGIPDVLLQEEVISSGTLAKTCFPEYGFVWKYGSIADVCLQVLSKDDIVMVLSGPIFRNYVGWFYFVLCNTGLGWVGVRHIRKEE